MFLNYFSILLSAGIWFYLIYRYDRFEPEPLKYVILVAVIGGILSTIPAALLNNGAASLPGVRDLIYKSSGNDASGISILLFSLFVGFNEEFWKSLIAVIILKRLKEFNEPIDALIYSMSIALGFAAFENIGYTLEGGLRVLFVRSFTVVPLHVGLASIWGSGIARAKYYKKGRYFRTLIPYVAAAAMFHALYNYIQLISSNHTLSLIIGLIFVLFVVLYAAGRLRYFQKESPFRRSGLCQHCMSLNSYFARYCKTCGSYIVTDFFSICPSCGIRNRIGQTPCRNCGKLLSRSSDNSSFTWPDGR